MLQALFEAQPQARYLVGTRWESDRVIGALIERLLDAAASPSQRLRLDELLQRIRLEHAARDPLRRAPEALKARARPPGRTRALAYFSTSLASAAAISASASACSRKPRATALAAARATAATYPAWLP